MFVLDNDILNKGLPTLLTGNIIAFVTQAFEEVIKTQFSFIEDAKLVADLETFLYDLPKP